MDYLLCEQIFLCAVVYRKKCQSLAGTFSIFRSYIFTENCESFHIDAVLI